MPEKTQLGSKTGKNRIALVEKATAKVLAELVPVAGVSPEEMERQVNEGTAHLFHLADKPQAVKPESVKGSGE